MIFNRRKLQFTPEIVSQTVEERVKRGCPMRGEIECEGACKKHLFRSAKQLNVSYR